jgi:hypothetical protein
VPSDKTFIMSAVIFDPAAAPSLEEYLQAVARKPTDEQESLLKDPVTMEWLKEPCYAGGRLWELSTVATLRSQAMSKGSTFWPHPLSRALIPCSLQPILADGAKAMIVACIAATSGVEVIADDQDDVRDKFPSDLTVGEGRSIMLNILLEAQAITWEKSIGYGMQKKFIESKIDVWFNKSQQGILSRYQYYLFNFI